MTNTNKENISNSSKFVQNKLMTILSEEMLTPLTSIMGMTSILNQEIYGKLTNKQREYVEVINQSSRYLQSLVEEIIALAQLEESAKNTEKTMVDLTNICQQIVKNLEPETTHRKVEVQLLAGASDQVLYFDKAILEQILYNLFYSVIQTAGSGSVVKIHLSQKSEEVDIAVWVLHPVLGDNLPHAQLYSEKLSEVENNEESSLRLNKLQLTYADLTTIIFEKKSKQTGNISVNPSQDLLALLFSCQLAEQNGGSLWIQGSEQLGYRYILAFPISN